MEVFKSETIKKEHGYFLKKQKKKKQTELYFRYLSSIGTESSLLFRYFIKYEFTFIRDRIIGKSYLKKALQKWDIINPKELKNKINWFLEVGMRKEFNQLRYQLTPLSEKARRKLIEDLEGKPEYAKLYVVNYSLHILNDSNIAAFDYAWCIYLCRIGKRLGYLSKNEAENYMVQAALLSQQAYSNWQEYFNACHIGNHFINEDANFTNSDKYFHLAITEFFTQGSPLLEIDWNNDLMRKQSI